MAFFQLKIDGAGELPMLMAQMTGRVEALDRTLPSIAELLIGAVHDVVDMEGPGWEALAPETLARRRQNGRGAKMLRDTGVMMGPTFSPGWGPDHASASFGVTYAIYHIKGKRNPFDLTPVEKGLYEDIKNVVLQGLA